MNVRRVNLTTDASGDASAVVRAPGEILGVGLVLGTSVSLDLDVDDTLTGKSVISINTVVADAAYRPLTLEQDAAGVDIAAAVGPPLINNVYAPVVCYGGLTVTLANGGVSKTATVYIAFRG